MILTNKIDLYSHFKMEKNGLLEGYLSFDDEPSKNGCAMVVIAGGGYNHVSKREQISVAKKYREAGFKTFILHYSTQVKFPTALVEASLAMAYVRQVSAKFCFDKDKVCGVGFSAGGHLLGCLGIIFDDEILVNELKKIEFFKNNDIEENVKPNLMILSYPVISSEKDRCHQGSFNELCCGDNRLIDQLSLEKRVNENSVSAFIWSTANDGSVPVYSSLSLALSYHKFKIPFALHVFEKGKHGLSVGTKEVNDEADLLQASTDYQKWVELSVNWLKDKGFC